MFISFSHQMTGPAWPLGCLISFWRLWLPVSSFLVYWNSIFIRLNSLSLSATQPSWTSCFYQTWSWPSRFPPCSCWWRLHSSWSFLMPDLNWSWPMQLFFLKKYGRAIQDMWESVNDYTVLKYIDYQLSCILPPSLLPHLVVSKATFLSEKA